MRLVTLLLLSFISFNLFAEGCPVGAGTNYFAKADSDSVPLKEAKKMMQKTVQLYTEDFSMSITNATKLFQKYKGEVDQIVYNDKIYYLAVIHPKEGQFGHIFRPSDLKIVAFVEDGGITNCAP